jgi:hypothetical protein
MIFISIFSTTTLVCVYFFKEKHTQMQHHDKVVLQLSNSIANQIEISDQFDTSFYESTIEKLKSRLKIIKIQVELLSLISNQ